MLMKPRIYFYEDNGVVQACYKRLYRFVDEGESITVGIGCDKDEAVAELLAKLEAR